MKYLIERSNGLWPTLIWFFQNIFNSINKQLSQWKIVGGQWCHMHWRFPLPAHSLLFVKLPKGHVLQLVPQAQQSPALHLWCGRHHPGIGRFVVVVLLGLWLVVPFLTNVVKLSDSIIAVIAVVTASTGITRQSILGSVSLTNEA